MMAKKKQRKGKHQSGWYKNPEGDVFHAHGKNMSDETIAALGDVARAVREMDEAGYFDKPHRPCDTSECGEDAKMTYLDGQGFRRFYCEKHAQSTSDIAASLLGETQPRETMRRMTLDEILKFGGSK